MTSQVPTEPNSPTPLTNSQANSKTNPKTSLKTILVPILLILGVTWGALSFLKSQVAQNKPAGRSIIELKAGNTLPDLELTRTDGTKALLSSIPAKVMLINFWATWCEACMEEMPSLVKLHEEYKQHGLEVIGINLDEKPSQAIASTAAEFGMKFQNFTDADGKLGDAFDVHAIPLTVIVDGSRKILEKVAGDRDWMHPAFTTKAKAWLEQAGQPSR